MLKTVGYAVLKCTDCGVVIKALRGEEVSSFKCECDTEVAKPKPTKVEIKEVKPKKAPAKKKAD